eukprot:gene9534-12229_t
MFSYALSSGTISFVFRGLSAHTRYSVYCGTKSNVLSGPWGVMPDDIVRSKSKDFSISTVTALRLSFPDTQLNIDAALPIPFDITPDSDVAGAVVVTPTILYLPIANDAIHGGNCHNLNHTSVLRSRNSGLLSIQSAPPYLVFKRGSPSGLSSSFYIDVTSLTGNGGCLLVSAKLSDEMNYTLSVPNHNPDSLSTLVIRAYRSKGSGPTPPNMINAYFSDDGSALIILFDSATDRGRQLDLGSQVSLRGGLLRGPCGSEIQVRDCMRFNTSAQQTVSVTAPLHPPMVIPVISTVTVTASCSYFDISIQSSQGSGGRNWTSIVWHVFDKATFEELGNVSAILNAATTWNDL